MAILKKLEWDVNEGSYIARYDDGSAYAAKELFVLNFNTASNLDYTNSALDIAVSNVAVAEVVSAEDQAEIVEKLNANAAAGTLYVTAAQAAEFGVSDSAVSNIYVGEVSGLESLGGFAGIAETTGELAAATADDDAFVDVEAGYDVDAVVATIEHEAGHLAGTVTHDYANDGATIDDYKTNYVISAGTVISGKTSTAYSLGANDTLSANGTVAEHVLFLDNTQANGCINIPAAGVNTVVTLNYTDFVNNSKACHIANSTTAFTASNCTFSNNRSAGAITLSNTGTAIGPTLFYNDVFTSNYTTGQGGAVYFYKKSGAASSTIFSSCTFIGNSAGTTAGQGGAIKACYHNVEIIDCYFSGNSARYAGAIGPEACSVTFKGHNTFATATDTLYTNTSGWYIFDLTDASQLCSITFESDDIAWGTFLTTTATGGYIIKLDADLADGTYGIVNNCSTIYGGVQAASAVIVSDTTSSTVAAPIGKVWVQDGKTYAFLQGANSAGQQGLLYIKGSAPVVTSTVVSGITLTSRRMADVASGATIEYDDMTVSAVKLVNTSAAVIWNSAGGTVTLKNANITSVYNSTNNAVNTIIRNVSGATMKVYGGTFSGNSGLGSGGGVYTNQGNLYVSGGTYTGNTAFTGTTKGGVINMSAAAAGSVYVENATFTSNLAGYQGGAIAVVQGQTSTTLDVVSCTFSGNVVSQSTNGQGGAVFMWNNAATSSAYTFKDTVFTSNSASGTSAFGGAVFIQGSTLGQTVAVFDNVEFNGNYAKNNGGAIFLDKGIAYLRNVTFSGNSATTTVSAGAIGGRNGGKLYFQEDVKFMTSTDTVYVYFDTYWDITDGKATVNDASGFKYMANNYITSVMNNTNGVYTLIEAGGSGVSSTISTKSMYLYNYNLDSASKVAMECGTTSSFGNTSYTLTYDSGAIVLSATAARTDVTGAKTLGTSDGWLGLTDGAMYVSAGGSVTGGGSGALLVEFNKNSADMYGAGIYNANGGTVNIHDVSFYGNEAAQGGAVYNAGDMTLSNFTLRTEDDDIYNAAGGSLTLAGNAVLSDANLTNLGSLTFAAGTNLSLLGTAEIIDYSGNDVDLSGVGLVFDNDKVKKGGIGIDGITLLSGNYTGITSATFNIGGNMTASTTLGNSFQNALNDTFWFGQRNSTTGVAEKLVLDNTASSESFYKFTSIDNIATTYNDFNGTIFIEGGTYTDSLFAGNASFEVNWVTVNGAKKYIYGDGSNEFGTHLNDTASVSLIGSLTGDQKISLNGITANNAAMGVYAGGEFDGTGDTTLSGSNKYVVTVEHMGEDNVMRMMAAGGNFKGQAGGTTYTINATSEITVTNGDEYLIVERAVAGSSVGSYANVTVNGGSTINIDGGKYAILAGAGFLQSGSGSLTVNGDVTMNLSGGTYGIVYGGALIQKAAWANGFTMNGNVAITVDTSTNAAEFSSIFLGSNGKANFGADCTSRTLTFTGNGSNLTFKNNGGVSGWNGTKGFDSDPIAELVFDGFTGNFTAPFVESFKAITFKGATTNVTFTENSVDLSPISEWSFETGTSTDANAGYLDFDGDVLIFGKSGDTLTEAWNVIAGSKSELDTFGDAAGVQIFGTAATFADGAWTAGSYKLYKSSDTQLTIASIA